MSSFEKTITKIEAARDGKNISVFTKVGFLEL